MNLQSFNKSRMTGAGFFYSIPAPLLILITVAVVMLSFPYPASAYVPPEWQDAVTNDVQLYQISFHFSNQSWAEDNLEYLVTKYTNRYRISSQALRELSLKMNWYVDTFNIIEPSYIAYCNDCLITISVEGYK